MPHRVRHAVWVLINGGILSSWKENIELGEECGAGAHYPKWTTHKVTENCTSYYTGILAVWYMGTTMNRNLLHKCAVQPFSPN